ncbi:MAG: hypothetical protein V1702_04665 [Candidatus Woesearchaeota archaeon]
MPKSITLDESYDKCVSEGNVILQDKIDINKIKSMMQIANDDLDSANSLMKSKEPKYGSIYKLYYEVLHQLTEAFLLFDKVKSYNHQCLFSYLCAKHPELDLDWNFFEKVRTKRNGIQYYGNQIAEKDWKEIKLQTELYIKTLSDVLEKKVQASGM